MTAHRYRVVIADDVSHLRTLVRLVLERSRRFDVVAEASTGEEALVATRDHRPDLTLLDLSMPVMDGLEALPLIRAEIPSTTVVVLSGFDADRMAGEALDAGAAAYLVKGIQPDHLVDQLVSLLDARDVEEIPELESAFLDSALVELPEAPESAGTARTFVRRTLEHWQRPENVDDAMLLATELVTNAVVHARSGVQVRLLAFADRIRVEVTDTGAGSLHLRTPHDGALSGRGLFMVQELARTWGTSSGEDAKVVWFEV